MKELRQGYKYNQLVSLSAEDIHLRDPNADHYAITIELKTNSESYFESASDQLNSNLTVPPFIWFAGEFGYGEGPVVRDWGQLPNIEFQMSIYETGQTAANGALPRVSFRVYDSITNDNQITDQWYCIHRSGGADHQKYATFIAQTPTTPAKIQIFNPPAGNQYDNTLFAVLSAVTDCDLKFGYRTETSYQMTTREVTEYRPSETAVQPPTLPNGAPNPTAGEPVIEELKSQV